MEPINWELGGTTVFHSKYTIENNTLILPHFTSTAPNNNILKQLLKTYAQSVFKSICQGAKIRAIWDFSIFVSSKLIYGANFPTLNVCRKSMKAQNGLKFLLELCFGIILLFWSYFFSIFDLVESSSTKVCMQALRLLINLSTNEHMIQYLHSANVSIYQNYIISFI